MNIVHYDIKAENILFTDEDCENLKIIDFCHGYQGSKGLDYNLALRGTTHFMAPEVFTSNIFDYRYDIWSLGILMYLMLVG